MKEIIASISLLILIVSIIWFIANLIRRKPWKLPLKVIAGSFLIIAIVAPNTANVKPETAQAMTNQAEKEKKQVSEWVNKVDNSINLTNNNIKTFDKVLNGTTNDADLYSDIQKLQKRIDDIDDDLTPPEFVKVEKEFDKALSDFKTGLIHRSTAYDKFLNYVDSKKPSDLAAGKDYLQKSIAIIDPAVKTIEKIKTDIANQYK